MDRCDRSQKELYHRHRERRENPSFSSTLLDAIYRSIDDEGTIEEPQQQQQQQKMIFHRDNDASHKNGRGLEREDVMAGYQREYMIEKWMEKKKFGGEKLTVAAHRDSTGDARRSSRISDVSRSVLLNSSSSSSDSSSRGGFSSSESESKPRSRSSSSCYSMKRPKPIRTSVSDQNAAFDFLHHRAPSSVAVERQKRDGLSFVKTKSKALKIYNDLKKANNKQPISPGARLASFLNSIFNAGSPKKAKIASSTEASGYQSSTTTCSSASSFSRSCLSKTPSSRAKSSNGVKRSVRFYPVSVIVDEDSRPCGQKNIISAAAAAAADKPRPMEIKALRTSTIEEIKFSFNEDNRKIAEAAREMLKNYQQKKQGGYETRDDARDSNVEDSDDDNDDDASCSSSDLFELDNLSTIGCDQRYREELPVYETTNLDTNRAIANGFVL